MLGRMEAAGAGGGRRNAFDKNASGENAFALVGAGASGADFVKSRLFGSGSRAKRTSAAAMRASARAKKKAGASDDFVKRR